ncbi:hypothetical protein ACOME3_008340 [Neoechinorhynchus agilis]
MMVPYRICKTLSAHMSDARCVQFLDKQEETIFFSGGRDGLARKWVLDQNSLDLVSDALVNEPPNGYVNALALMSDGDWLHTVVVIGGTNKVVRGYDCEGNEVFSLEDHSDNICHLTYSTKLNLLVSCSWDCSLVVYDATDRKNPRFMERLSQHDVCVWSSALSDALGMILSGSADGKIGVWRFSDQGSIRFDRMLSSFHSTCVRSVCVLLNGQRAASASNDFTIAVFDLITFSLVHRFVGHESFIFDIIAFEEEDGEAIASAGEDHTLRIWNVDSKSVKQIIHLPATTCWSIAFNEGILLAACNDGNVRVISKGRCEMPELTDEYLHFSLSVPPDDPESMPKTVAGTGRFEGDYQYVLEHGMRIVGMHSFLTASSSRTLHFLQLG